jgi:hypothetical protein
MNPRRLPILFALLIPSLAFALDETHVYGIANFGGTGQCGAKDQTHAVHTSTAAAFRTVFGLLKPIGYWDAAYSRNNTAARGS